MSYPFAETGRTLWRPNRASYRVVDDPNIFFLEPFDQERTHIVEIGVQLCLIFGTVHVKKKIAEQNVNIVANDASPGARNI